MEDYNKQPTNDSSSGQSGNMPQVPAQSNGESTYWENGDVNQNQAQNGYPNTASQPYQQQNQTYYTNQPDPNNYQNQNYQGQNQQPASQQTPDQFYTNYQQQMYGQTAPGNGQQQFNNQPYQSNTYYQTPKKKSHGKLIAAIVVLLILCSGAVTAYAFRGTILNTLSQMTKSPSEYYASVEKEAINKTLDSVKPYLDLSEKDTAYEVTSDFTIDRDTVNSLLQETGYSLEDLESQIGIPLESLGIKGFVGHKDNIINSNATIRLNKVDLITMEFFMDTAKQELFARFPELSKAFMDVSPEDLYDSSDIDMSKLDLINTEQITRMLKRYSTIIAENAKDVDMEKNYELSLDTISTKCTKLTVNISNSDLSDIAQVILETAKTDQDILDLLPLLDMSKSDFEDAIDEAESEIDDSLDEMDDVSLKMHVYVDSQGNIIGREILSDDTDISFGYTYLTEGSKNEYALFVNDENGDDLIKIEGSQKKDNGAYDGSATIDVSDPSEELFSDVSIDLEYQDFRTEIKDNRTYQYGSFTLSSLDLMGIQINADYDVEGSKQISKVVFQMGASPLVTIDTEMNYLKDYKVEMPPEDAEVYAPDQMEDYTATMDIEGYISSLSDKLGVDLQSLYDSLIGGYEDYDY